ncbi:M23 family metallopeptidase [Pseudonocardia alni]|jgi:murein DD-endopeptidase MepM/ murein hydrolase activator NlpD|uniref:Peptidase M23-like protein n=2 Tax=Pseudonocardia alni TaxID=33907 RepID=A0AA44ZSI2_PSEA5|nr:M23 family metallopeptidase [Pseudonocardia alni]NWJ75003.1 M23 family metallopeptidase [Pseudonocardia pini]NWJ75141.1 M23 family metallopeptidase [Pseudonocardia pini]PKB41166.1 peptidase M23-like protein [Pseudonocardia alni]WFG47139.1 M23 family metallopeptidase [Pseudonocardia alni]
MSTSSTSLSSCLPAPPPAGAGAVAALAAGALVTGAQATYDELDLQLVDDEVRPVAALSLEPASIPAPDRPAVVAPVAASELPDAADPDDLAALAKGTRIGEESARRADQLSAARAEGAPAAVTAASGEVTVQPVRGRITSTAGPRWGSTHYGLDIANRIGTPIFAVADGVVEKSGPANGFGLWVVVRHPDGSRSVYGHINQAFVAAGERVAAGDRIAEVGNRGQSTGPHLHLEIRQGSVSGEKVDPVGWLRARGLELTG